jgi:isoleucyl-tRNA synthetase
MAKELKDTLNLPQTEFPMRADLVRREPNRITHWDQNHLYQAIQDKNADGKCFVLHDGPPFTNGDVHIGTALNKILKDFILRYKSMRGYRTPYVPGWDCHGLPIEHKVAQKLRDEKREVSTLELRQECAQFSESFIKVQKSQFRRLGILTDWSQEYRTMDPSYEAEILRVFACFVRQNRIYRGKKPVYWSIPCETALAEAEIEYKDHVSASVWVRFEVEKSSVEIPGDGPLHVVIWTTTPWTIPANLAIALHPDLDYVAVQHGSERLILAQGCLERFVQETKLESAPTVLASFKGRDLEGTITRHPLIDRKSPIVLADYVTTESGTGCVHTAPGHGMDDYLTGLRYGLDIYCPVSDDGRYVDDGQIPSSLVGVSVLERNQRCEANEKVLAMLQEARALFHKESYRHSYPHCWRSKTPVIFRAVDQWFINLDEGGLRQKTLDAIGQVSWVPAGGESRIRGAVENRPDWCISRQRSWGVPIPAFFNDQGEAFLDADVIEGIANKVEQQGTDLWFQQDAAEILKGLPVPSSWNVADLKKGRDTLDVWIDSGSSHLAVLKKRGNLHWPADIYLEGSDQHRGWFQSSLWTSMVSEGAPPYRTVLTHGFIVGQDGKKISKSDGKPQTADSYIQQYGVDVIRLWLASEEFRKDIPISTEILENISRSYRLIRNTLRFQLSNLYDFDLKQNGVPIDQLPLLDRWALHQTALLAERVSRAYEAYEFHQVVRECNDFCSVTLSAIYHDILKDRLYTLHPNAPLRRASQTVIYHCLHTLTRLLAPILLFTADETWSFLSSGQEYSSDSVHLQSWPVIPDEWKNAEAAEELEQILQIRDRVNESLETLRKNKIIGQSLEADLTITAGDSTSEARVLAKYEERLPEIFIVSRVTVVTANSTDALQVTASKATGVRCPRCWRYVDSLVEHQEFGHVCPRCSDALQS